MRRMHSAPAAAALLALLALLLAACPNPTDSGDDQDAESELENRVETLFERFVERYGEDGPLEQWVYDGDGVLTENIVYEYEAFTEAADADGDGTLEELRIASAAVYSSATVHDAATQTAAMSYTYDGNTRNILRGELREAGAAGLELTAAYDATYDPVSGLYDSFLLVDGTGAVIEHRVSTYNPDGTYAEETFYRDAAGTDVKERYTPEYSGSPSRPVRETHYVRIPAVDGEAEDYETTTVNVFAYNGDDRYLQSTYSAAQPGVLVSLLLYTFGDYGPAGASYREKRTRSVINADGQLMLYRSYAYDPDGYAVGVSYFDYAAAEGQELRSREAFSYYEVGSGNYHYEASTYTYSYPASTASSRALDVMRPGYPAARVRLAVPALAHCSE